MKPTRLFAVYMDAGTRPAFLTQNHRNIRRKWLLIAGLLAVLHCCLPAAIAGLANSSADTRTRNIYTFITGMTSGTSKRFMSGQNLLHYAPASDGLSYENDLIWNLQNQTGQTPAIVGADMNDSSTNAMILPELVTLAQMTGCVIEIDGGLTYPNQTSGQSLNHLLPGGADRAAWITSMQTLATKLQYLQACNVTVLYRPFHEMNGSWCPYYTTDTTSFQNLWIDLFNYMTTTAGLNNLIWVWAPNNAGGSAAYNQLVSHPEYVDNSHTQTITLNNLTVGHSYQVQVWAAYINAGHRGIELSGSSGLDSITLESGTGQYTTGTFTASATSYSFTGTPAAANTLSGTGWAADGNLNAVSVRDITSGTSYGSQIQWGPALRIGSDSDLATNGTYFDAALLNSTANGGSPVTINGVTFNIVASGTSNATDPSGHISLTSQRTQTTGGNSPSGPPSAQPYYPGSSYVDIVGADVYNDTAFMTEYNWLKTLAKPIFYTEFGNGGTGVGTYNGTYNFETQFLSTIKSSYPQVSGFMAWSDWISSGTWIYKSIARNVDGGMMADPWTVNASDLQSRGLGSPLSGLTGYYEITNQATGASLTCNSFTQGAVLSGSAYGGNYYQQWGIAPDESGTGYTVTNEYSGQVAICPSPGTSGTTPIEQYGEATWEYKTWNINANSDGTYTIFNSHYPTEAIATSGTAIVISSATSSSNAKWILTPLFTTTGTATFQQGLNGYNGYTGPTYTGAAGSYLGTSGTNDETWNFQAIGTGTVSTAVSTGFLEFNLGTAVPTGATITSATLKLYLHTTWSNGSNKLYAAPITSSWNPATLSGSTVPSFDRASAANITIPNLAYNGGAEIGTITVDITSIVQSWVNGTRTNYGLAFYSDSTYMGMGAWNASIYNITPTGENQSPLLTIVYTSP